MTFKNEYIPPIEQETSEFLKQARRTLNTGHSKYDYWTIDREQEIVLIHKGGGRREIGDSKSDLWACVDHGGYYVFSMEQTSYVSDSLDAVAISYKLEGFWEGERYSVPSAETIDHIKEALCEHGKSYMFDLQAYKRCEVTLINDTVGKDI